MKSAAESQAILLGGKLCPSGKASVQPKQQAADRQHINNLCQQIRNTTGHRRDDTVRQLGNRTEE
jgi:hypothetical protein